MADRILAAMDYLDSHTKLVLQKPKQRALGDIDGKYSVVDPLLEISYYPSLKSDGGLAGIKKINPSNEKTPDEIVEEDREKMVQSAQRARSAPAPYKDSPLISSARPMTSSSWVTGSLGGKDDDRHIHSMLTTMTSASHPSVKRLSFTSPAVKVGPADVRDDVMDEIVNKPLVFRRNDIKSQSAPPGGRMTSRYLRSAGTKSARWVTSPKRARTSLHRRRRPGKSWEKNPGPFMTVKVSGQDLWIVSNSTPTSYFDDSRDDGLRETSGMNGTKLPKWEQAAEAVPKQEQKSPPRHERLLGAPAQFAPTIQWLRYDPGAPIKKPPLLTPFKSSSEDGRYYNVESSLTNKVNQHLTASPGVRIARNGAVLSHSLKLESSDESGQDSDVGSEQGDESDIDIASLVPGKLAAKIRKHYSNLEENGRESNSESEEEGEEKNVKSDLNIINDLLNGKLQKEKSSMDRREEKEDNDDSDEESTLSSVSEEAGEENIEGADEEKSREEQKPLRPPLTKDTLSLLTKLTGHNLSNPLLEGSNGSATSQEDSIESYDMNGYPDHNGVGENGLHEAPNGHPEGQDDVWAVVENGTPGFWISRSKQHKLALLKRLRRQRMSEQPTSGRESLKSSQKQEDVEEVILPLCWDDELTRSNAKVVDAKIEQNAPSKQDGNTSLPVVFHKVLRYDRLPAATTASPIKPATAFTRYRPRSAISYKADGVPVGVRPSKGYRAPVSTPRSNRSVRSKSASSTSSLSAHSGRGHSAPQSLTNGTEIIRQSLDLADLLRVTPDSFPTKNAHVTTRSHVIKKERVTIVHDDISEREMEAVRQVAAQNMKGQIEGDILKETDDGSTATPREILSHRKEDANNRLPVPVGPLNLSSIDSDMTSTNDTTPITITTQRRSEERSASLVTPQNTPKSPMVHRSPMLTPKTSARGPPAIHFPANIEKELVPTAVEITQDGKRAQQGTIEPPTSKLNGSQAPPTKSPMSTRSKGGFAASPLTQNRMKSGTIRAPTSAPNGTRPMKALATPGMNTTVDGTIMIPNINVGPPVNGPPSKAADFIQITQSLHISQRSGTPGEPHGVTGSKMYNSYMRELAAHGGQDFDDGRAMIVGRSLGGTSGKSSILSLPRSVKRNLAGYRTSGAQQHAQGQAQVAPNVFPFAPQAGRRSGLTMVPQDKMTQQAGPFGLGVKGDQVRLNIDKNINNIYRDLGLLKGAIVAPKGDHGTPSPGRSHVSSAKSRSQQKDESVISIPTASNASAVNGVIDRPATNLTGPSEGGVETVIGGQHLRPSSSNPSIVVQDSGTQWSNRTPRTPETGKEIKAPQKEGTSTDAQAPPSKEATPVSTELGSPTLAINLENISNDPGTSRTQSQEGEEKPKAGESPTSERSTGRALSRSSDAPSGGDSAISGQSAPPTIHRSASETLLDRLAELGERASDVTDDVEEEEDENDDVKGVTRVTVNIPEVKPT